MAWLRDSSFSFIFYLYIAVLQPLATQPQRMLPCWYIRYAFPNRLAIVSFSQNHKNGPIWEVFDYLLRGVTDKSRVKSLSDPT